MRDRLQTAVESLDLTDDQKAKVKDMFADAKTQRQTIMNDASLGEDKKKAKMKELHQATKSKVNNVLTPVWTMRTKVPNAVILMGPVYSGLYRPHLDKRQGAE